MELAARKIATFHDRGLCYSACQFISLVICVVGGTAHYRKASLGRPMAADRVAAQHALFACSLLQQARGSWLAGFKSLVKPKTAFFLFWILFFVVSHLWNFRTAPWNGDALFDESGWDLWYLKSYVIGHPYQAGLVSYCYFARDPVSLLCLGFS